jgi:hypothetical protein
VSPEARTQSPGSGTSTRRHPSGSSNVTAPCSVQNGFSASTGMYPVLPRRRGPIDAGALRELEVIRGAGQSEHHAVVAGMVVEPVQLLEAQTVPIEVHDVVETAGRTREPHLAHPEMLGPSIGSVVNGGHRDGSFVVSRYLGAPTRATSSVPGVRSSP